MLNWVQFIKITLGLYHASVWYYYSICNSIYPKFQVELKQTNSQCSRREVAGWSERTWPKPKGRLDWTGLDWSWLVQNLGFIMKKLTRLDRLIWTESPLAAGQFFGHFGGVSRRTSTDMNPWNWTNLGQHLHLIVGEYDWLGRIELDRASASQS